VNYNQVDVNTLDFVTGVARNIQDNVLGLNSKESFVNFAILSQSTNVN